MPTLVSLDKMQNISTLMRKSSKSEGRAFWKLFKWNWFRPSSKIRLLPFQGGTFLGDHLCYICIVLFMLSRLLIAALWSPAGRGLTSWLSCVVLNCVIVTFPYGILGQVWNLILSISDLCPLSYFHTVRIVLHISAALVQWLGHRLHTNWLYLDPRLLVKCPWLLKFCVQLQNGLQLHKN